jgi:hypothetical protein
MGSDKIDIRPGAPSLSLGLSEDSLKLSVGIACKGEHLTASWLDEEAIANAVKILESSEAIQFIYKDDHIVLIEKKTGLLLKDIWPNPARPGPRYIALKRHSRLKRNVPYSSLIPSFDSIKIEELPPQHLYKQMFFSILTELGHNLSDIDRFDQTVEHHSDEITAAVRKTGRVIIREDTKKRVDREKAKEFAEEFLFPTYERYKEKHPQKASDLSFPDFLSNLMQAAEANPSAVVLPGSRKLTEAIQKECENILDQLPEDAQQPLRKLYDQCISALVEGWYLEFLSATLDQAKTFTRKENKKVSNQAIDGLGK